MFCNTRFNKGEIYLFTIPYCVMSTEMEQETDVKREVHLHFLYILLLRIITTTHRKAINSMVGFMSGIHSLDLER